MKIYILNFLLNIISPIFFVFFANSKLLMASLNISISEEIEANNYI